MKIVYKCDPEKNAECKKTVCQELCFMTSKKECSSDGIPMVYDEVKKDFINVNQREENLDPR